jgi:hypothetical protein
MKLCTLCKETKDYEQFHKDSGKKDGHQSRCKDCVRATTLNWQKNNPEKAKQHSKKATDKWQKENKEKLHKPSKEWRKFYRIKEKYGLSKEEFNEMESEQSGICKICEKDKPLCVDHCHTSGRVRGLLCRDCNLLLGFAFDNTETLKKAADYLIRAC